MARESSLLPYTFAGTQPSRRRKRVFFPTVVRGWAAMCTRLSCILSSRSAWAIGVSCGGPRGAGARPGVRWTSISHYDIHPLYPLPLAALHLVEQIDPAPWARQGKLGTERNRTPCRIALTHDHPVVPALEPARLPHHQRAAHERRVRVLRAQRLESL